MNKALKTLVHAHGHGRGRALREMKVFAELCAAEVEKVTSEVSDSTCKLIGHTDRWCGTD